MSGWDWLHAGLEVATYAKAQKAQRELAEMKTTAEMAEARRVLLETMKSFIFDISRDIKLAEEQLTEFPQQVYIISRSLDWRLVDSGLFADVFPDFQDKEYVLETEKKIAKVIEESKAKLTQQQIQQSETAVQYIAEMPMLEQAVSAKSAKESLEATEEEWQELSSRQGKKKLFMVLGLTGIAISACVGLPLIFGGLSILTSGGLGNVIGGLLMTGAGGAIPVGAVVSLVFGSKSNPGYTSLKDNREIWQEQLMPQEDWQRVISTWGDLTSDQFEGVREERLAFLRPLLGGDFQKYLTPGG